MYAEKRYPKDESYTTTLNLAPEHRYIIRRKRSALSSWIFNLKNWYFSWLLFKDFIIRKWPCSLLLLPLSPCPQQPHSGPIFSTDCSFQGPNHTQCEIQRALPEGLQQPLTLYTTAPWKHSSPVPTTPAPLSSLSPLLLLPVTSGSFMSHGRCPRMTFNALRSSLTMRAITGCDNESKHLPRSLFGANTRAVYPAASWAVYWTGRQTPSILYIPPCLFTTGQYPETECPQRRLLFYYCLDYSQDVALKQMLL